MRAAARRFLASLVGLCTLTLASAARAQDSPPAPAPAPAPASAPTPASASAPATAVTPPVVLRNDGATYPRQALDEGITDVVVVNLVSDVDSTGKVTHATVKALVGHGFDEAATEAALEIQFSPALRDGTPVAARTSMTYTFAPPPAVLSGHVVGLAGSRPIAGATVTVRDAAGEERAVATDASGEWRIEGLPAGTYHVTIAAPGMIPHEADQPVKPGEEASPIDPLTPPPPPPPPSQPAPQ